MPPLTLTTIRSFGVMWSSSRPSGDQRGSDPPSEKSESFLKTMARCETGPDLERAGEVGIVGHQPAIRRDLVNRLALRRNYFMTAVECNLPDT